LESLRTKMRSNAPGKKRGRERRRKERERKESFELAIC